MMTSEGEENCAISNAPSPMGPTPAMATVLPGLNLSVEDAALEPDRQNVDQHDKRFFIRPFWNRIEASA
jgi:hypothetical protein